MDVRVVSSPPIINAALAEKLSAILVIWNTELRVLQAAPAKGWMPELANGPGSNPGAVKRMQDRDLLHPPARRDDGIGKRTRLESEGGKTHARSERALSATV